jgi:hypothetical protein
VSRTTASGVADDISGEEYDTRFRALEAEELAKDFGRDVVWVNGPRRALMNSLTGLVFDEATISMVGAIPMFIGAACGFRTWTRSSPTSNRHTPR